MTASAEHLTTRRIAALQGAESAHIQALLANFALLTMRQGYHVVGVVEIRAPGPAGGCRRLALRDLANGAVTSISQDLGPGSSACNLDAGALAQACGRVETCDCGRRRSRHLEQVRQARGRAWRARRCVPRCGSLRRAHSHHRFARDD